MTPLARPDGVAAAVERVRAHLRRRAAFAASLWGGAALALVLALAWGLAGPSGWRQGSPTPLILDLALLGMVALLVSLTRRGRTWLADAPIARAMERSVGLEGGAVEGALELARAVPRGASGSLAAFAEEGVARRLALPEDRLVGALGFRARRWILRGGAALALTAPFVVLLLALSPQRSRAAWAGLGRPVGLLARPVYLPLEVTPGDAEVLRGSTFTVTVVAPGREEVTLHWQAVGDVARAERAETGESGARFHFPSVGSEIVYSATTADGARSREYRVMPVDPLLVSDVTIGVAFPPHTGRASEEYRGDVPPLSVPAGTRFRFEGRATRPLDGAELEREEDGLRVQLEAVGAGFVGSWTPTSGGVFHWRFHDLDGGEAEVVPPPLEVDVVPDSVPRVRFAFPAVDTVLPLTLRQPLVIEVADDYGVAALDLVAYRVTSLGERRPPVIRRMDMGAARALLARPLMDLTSWGLLPGDTVRYFARATDNAPSPSTATTREYVLRMPEVSELRREAQEQLDATAERVADLADRARRAGEASREAEREAGSGPDPAARAGGEPSGGAQAERSGFEEREALRRAIEEQSSMSAEAERAGEELRAIAEALREAGASDPELQRQLEELGALLEAAASPELRERMTEMSARLEGAEAGETRQTLESLAAEQQRFRERLEESLDQLRRAAVEQDFRATTQDARELAQRQRALADAVREGGREALRARQQEGLRAEAGELGDRLERLEERLSRLDEEDARTGVERAGEENARSEKAMGEAQGALAGAGEDPRPEGPPGGDEVAARRAQDAAEAMERSAEVLEQARDALSSARAEALQKALERTGEDALALARRQEALRERMDRRRTPISPELLGDEAALMQGLRNMAESLEAEAGGTGAATRQISGELGRSMEAVQQTLAAMEGDQGPRPAPEAVAEGAVEALNRLAMSAMAAAEQTGRDAGSGADQLAQQLAQLAQQQSQLNNRAGQVLPMQLGSQAMRQQMEQLAQGQQEVAGELGDLSRRPGAESQTPGDLEALAEEARQLAELLDGGRLDAETRERQERLFHRLLDAGRSLEKEEFSDERESRTPGTFERGEVLPLGAGELGVLRFALPSAAELRRLSPAARELVLRYFDRLNRVEESAPEAPR